MKPLIRSCILLSSVISATTLVACAPATVTTEGAPAPATSAASSGNPFFVESTLPYHAPRFDLIRNEDYEPAFEEGMRQDLAEIDRIAKQTAPPTFENTIVAMERGGALLTRVSKAFSGVYGANTNDTLQHVQEVEAPKLAAHNDAIYLNDQLYQRVRTIYDRRNDPDFTPEQKELIDRYNRNFVRAGARLSEPDKVRMRALNKELSELSTEFTKKLLAGTKAGALVVDNVSDLAGLTADEIKTASEAAKDRGLAGKWVLPLQNTTQQPAQAELTNRAVRQRLFELSTLRTSRNDSNDTKNTIKRMAELRAEKAKLLGYPTWAAYVLETQGAKTPENAIKLLTDLVPPATARARAEATDIQKLIDTQGGGFKLQPWDWQYYAEQVRKAKYDLDESQIMPYFELNNVLQNGVFYAANKLYGITFKERHDIPVYHPDVRTFEVFDANGQPLALFYADYFKRDNKQGGAWMDQFVDQSKLMGTKPVVYNVANFTKPAAGQPALLTYDDVTTMFHEFGHALHGMFSNVEYPTLSGTNVPRDFVEFPSQFNEHWALDPIVFANYAKHYQTGAPMPAALVAKIKNSQTFNQGFAFTELLEASLLDFAWHTLAPGTIPSDVDSFETAALERFNVAVPEIPPRYRSTYFSHIWDGGYSAGYYAYTWSEVVDDDAYAWFREHGGLTRENGQRFRDMVLSRGGTEDAATMYREFRGRDPNVDALLESRGLKPPTLP
ncbi:MAG TPA: peptidyl-dipeptidase Dcp [Gemmatimonadaceae bacterium]|jgi:peptidyl-dipeptidase Dcp|nr:peptidyl-dipeptidase Dcp [Gemmatimonadaceae bacterium]